MHPRTEELLRHLDANRAVLHAAVDAVPPALRETKPGPNRWSVAETLEHLSRVEEGITRLLALRLSEAGTAGLLQPERDESPVAGSIDHALITDRRRQITAGERVLSAYTLGDGTVVWIITEADRSSTCILRPDEY